MEEEDGAYCLFPGVDESRGDDEHFRFELVSEFELELSETSSWKVEGSVAAAAAAAYVVAAVDVAAALEAD